MEKTRAIQGQLDIWEEQERYEADMVLDHEVGLALREVTDGLRLEWMYTDGSRRINNYCAVDLSVLYQAAERLVR